MSGDADHRRGKARQRVATFAVDGEVRFASAADRAAFAEELAGAVTRWSPSTTTSGPPAVAITAWSLAVHPSVKRAVTTESKET